MYMYTILPEKSIRHALLGSFYGYMDKSGDSVVVNKVTVDSVVFSIPFIQCYVSRCK